MRSNYDEKIAEAEKLEKEMEEKKKTKFATMEAIAAKFKKPEEDKKEAEDKEVRREKINALML